MRHVQIVSAPMPSGVAWLLNCLLELGIRTTSDGAGWVEEAEGSRIAPAEVEDNLRWYLPALHRRRHFKFNDQLEVFWSHRLSFAHFPARQTLLYVRDPRDEVYSQFRRLEHLGCYRQSEGDLFANLNQAEIWPISFPFMFDLPPADTLAYFNLCCLQLVPPDRLLVLRHEDSKRDPLGQLRRVMNFLGVQRSPDELSEAIEASDIRHSLEISEAMQASTGEARRGSRAGKVGEWKNTLSPLALSRFRGPAEVLIQLMGYEPLPVGTPQREFALSPALLAKTEPLLQTFQTLLAKGAMIEAESLIKQALSEAVAAQDGDRADLLAGQWLALLWTRSTFLAAQSHLPAAAAMACFFAAMNAQFGGMQALRQAGSKIRNPQHPLHFLWPSEQVYTESGLSTDAEFAKAAASALNSGLPYFLWQLSDKRLDAAGLFQLCALLDLMPADALMPLFEQPMSSAAGAEFKVRAQLAHLRWGAEFEPVRLDNLPACLLIRTQALETLDDLSVWLKDLTVYRALGVLAGTETI